MPENNDPPNKVLIEAVLDGLKHGVIFLVDNETPTEDIARLAKKTERLAFQALVEQFGDEIARRFFIRSENPWILRTMFRGWVFFYPIDVLTPETSLAEVGQPDFVFWPDAGGNYARVPWLQWSALRAENNVYRPVHRSGGPRTVWERLRDP